MKNTVRVFEFNAQGGDFKVSNSVCYSGVGNHFLAKTIAQKGEGELIEQAPGGKKIFGEDAKLPGSQRQSSGVFAQSFEKGQIRIINTTASHTYAAMAEGDVKVRACGASKEGIYRRVELKTLMANPKVTSIEGVKKSDLARLFKAEHAKTSDRSQATQLGYDRIHRRVCIATIRNLSREARQTAEPSVVAAKTQSLQQYKRQQLVERNVTPDQRTRLYQGLANKTDAQQQAETRLDYRRAFSNVRLERTLADKQISPSQAATLRASNEATFAKIGQDIKATYSAETKSSSEGTAQVSASSQTQSANSAATTASSPASAGSSQSTSVTPGNLSSSVNTASTGGGPTSTPPSSKSSGAAFAPHFH